MVVSLIAMCSATSAIDQRSGPALNVHCAFDSPEIEATNACCVCCRCFSNESRSCCVSGWAAAGATERVNARAARATSDFGLTIQESPLLRQEAYGVRVVGGRLLVTTSSRRERKRAQSARRRQVRKRLLMPFRQLALRRP